METRKAGARRHLLQIERLTRVPARDGFTETWTEQPPPVWGEVRAFGLPERVVAGTQETTTTHEIRIDWRLDLLPTDRLVRVANPDQRYYIRAMADEDLRGITWRLTCEERITTP